MTSSRVFPDAVRLPLPAGPPAPPRPRPQLPPPAPPWPGRPVSAAAARQRHAPSPLPEQPDHVVGEAAVDATQRGSEHRDGDGGSQEQGGHSGTTGADPTAWREALDPKVAAIGDVVARLLRHELAQTVWSARIPLEAGLLADTVLFLAYSPAQLDLRFQTTQWDVRELLETQLPLLRRLLLEWLPAGTGVSLTL